MILVIFDIDGTLTDTSEIDHHCFQKTYEHLFGLNWDDFNWNNIYHVSDSGLANSYFMTTHNRLPNPNELSLLQETFMDYLSSAYKTSPSKFKAVAGARKILKHMAKTQKYHIALATGCWEVSANYKLNAAQIEFDKLPLAHADHHFDRAEILRKAIQLSIHDKGQLEQVVYIGDGIWDAKTTNRINIPFVGIDYHRDGILKSFGTEMIIRDYSDVEIFESAIERSIINFNKNENHGHHRNFS